MPTYQIEDDGSTELADWSAMASANEEVLPRRRLSGGGKKAESNVATRRMQQNCRLGSECKIRLSLTGGANPSRTGCRREYGRDDLPAVTRRKPSNGLESSLTGAGGNQNLSQMAAFISFTRLLTWLPTLCAA